MKKSMKQKISMILFFLFLIFAATVATFFYPKKEFSEKENRSLAKFPAISVSSYFSGEFAKDYESYLTDQFPLRDFWIGFKTQIERMMLKQESNDVYFAKHDYLIEKHTGTFTNHQADVNITLLGEFMKQCVDTYGADHVTAMVVPNAVDILTDYLPAYAAPYNEDDYLQRVAQAMPEGVWFDSGSVLREYKSDQLYYKTDHHWTTYAAYEVYAAWAAAKGLSPLTADQYEVTTVTNDFKGTIDAKVGGDNASDSILMFTPKENLPYQVKKSVTGEVSDTLYNQEALNTRDKYGFFFGGNAPATEVTVLNQSKRRLLVIKDSYANCFLPFTFHDFSEVDFLDMRYYNESLKAYMEKNQYTDVLFLYNASGFAEDSSLMKLMN